MKKKLVIALSVILIIAVIGVVVFTIVLAMNKQKNIDTAISTNDQAAASAPAIETRYDEHYKVGVIQTGLGSASKDCYGGFMMELDENGVLASLDVEYIVEDNEELCRTKIKELIAGGDIDLLYTIGRFASETAAELTRISRSYSARSTAPMRSAWSRAMRLPAAT